MMKLHVSRMGAALLCVVALSWFLPYMYVRVTRAERFQVNGHYSPALQQFVLWESGAEKVAYKDEQNAPLTMREARSYLPFVFIGDAEKWGRFPVTVAERTITAEQAKLYNQYSSVRPGVVNSFHLPLYFLFESEPEGAGLEMPTDVLRFSEQGAEFIESGTGAIQAEKSTLFSNAMQAAGVVFPVTAAGSNPQPQKLFDEGVFFADAKNVLFQMKMEHGKPLVRNTRITVPGTIRGITVEEHPKRYAYGLVITDSDVYLNLYAGRLQKLPLAQFNAQTDNVSIRSDALHWVLGQRTATSSTNPLHLVALTSAFSPVHTHTAIVPEAIVQRKEWVEKGLSVLSPFRIAQFTATAGGVHFLFEWAPYLLFSFLGVAVSLVGYAAMRRKYSQPFHWIEVVFIVCCGLPGMIAVLCFGPLAHSSSGYCTRTAVSAASGTA